VIFPERPLNLRAKAFIRGRFARGSSRVVWIADVLPNEIAGTISSMMDQGASVMKQTLERVAPVK